MRYDYQGKPGNLDIYQGMPEELEVYTDSDWAGCKESRKSTSGGIVSFGSHVVKSWSVTQKVIATSSAEAEYYAMVKGTSNALGIRGILRDLGVIRKVRLNTDASAAKGICNRKGLGKIRHLEVSQLWLQDKVNRGEVLVKKIRGDLNPADALTKGVNAVKLSQHMVSTSQELWSGRHELMPQVAVDE